MVLSLPLLSCESPVSVKENPDRKKKKKHKPCESNFGCQWCYGFIFDLLRQFVTKYDRYYYNIRQLFYYKMWQTFITKCDSYYKIWRLLQIATVRRYKVLYVFKIKHTGKILSKIFHWSYFLNNFRSSRPDVFCKKGVLRNFAKFTGKHLWILDFE